VCWHKFIIRSPVYTSWISFTNTESLIIEFGIFGNGDGQFNFPHSVVIDPLSMNVYVTDMNVANELESCKKIHLFSCATKQLLVLPF
jgi:hypothetical protein